MEGSGEHEPDLSAVGGGRGASEAADGRPWLIRRCAGAGRAFDKARTDDIQINRTRAQAAARILEIQTRVKPDPEGWTIRDYIDRGRPKVADLVIDASLASAWCFPGERSEYANQVLRTVSFSMKAFAPRFWAYEIRNSVLAGLRRRRIGKADAESFLGSLADLNIHLADPVSYDAAYLYLAIREGAHLASLDHALPKMAVNSGVALFPVPRASNRGFCTNFLVRHTGCLRGTLSVGTALTAPCGHSHAASS